MLSNNKVEYITEDTLIINYKNLSVIPFKRPILLRESSLSILNKYNNCFSPENLLFNKILNRYLFFQNINIKPDILLCKLSKIYFLERIRDCAIPNIRNVSCKYGNNIILENSALPFQIKNNIKASISICNQCCLKIMEYENLEGFSSNIDKIICEDS